jgi:nucleotide-binding universal stress UspA family protein
MRGLRPPRRVQALSDFQRARRQAAFEEILARFTGRCVALLSYEEVRQKFKLRSSSSRGLKEVPLEAIVGSVGRYQDFTRSFLPRQDSDAERWAGVELAILDMNGLPPVDLYQLGQIYFVVDGNHRVSVARQLGATHIQAYVTEFQIKVPLEPGDQPQDIIIKAEYAEFLERTQLDQLRPEINLKVTNPDRYWELETQIEATHYHLNNLGGEQDIPYAEAVCHWYDQIYQPVIQIIQEREILQDFPGRTETDLYLWILRHQSRLNQRLGWRIDPESAALDLLQQQGSQVGLGRREWLGSRPHDQLFGHILVPFSGEGPSWSALEQAILIAQQEKGQLLGLTVIPSSGQVQPETAQQVKAEFERRCHEAGVPGQFSIETGSITRAIYERAVWADLVVVHLAHPPEAGVFRRLGSGFRTILHRCPRPILAVPGPISKLGRALLAYDGSPKAQEGLFVAAYLASHWQLPLVVVTVIKQDRDEVLLEDATSRSWKWFWPALWTNSCVRLTGQS